MTATNVDRHRAGVRGVERRDTGCADQRPGLRRVSPRQAGSASATVSWTAPSNGGSAITSYTLTPYVGTTAQTPTTVSGSPPSTTATVTGLTNGTAYTFTVSATNAVGTGAAVGRVGRVTPAVPLPGAPTA